MKDEELREEFKERFCRVVYDDEGRELLTFREDDILLADEVSEFIEKALKAKEEEVVEGVEKMMPGDKEVNFEENNEAGIKRKVLFEILATLKGKKK